MHKHWGNINKKGHIKYGFEGKNQLVILSASQRENLVKS
jgi:hypothetical protein